MRLAPLQRWMQAVVVHPGTTRQALRSREAARHLPAERLDSVLLPSQTLRPAERLAIYQEMYPLRMRDALSSDYPALEHFLGDQFWAFVTAYTAKHPSMGYTLNRLGDHVPAFLGRQQRFGNRAFLKDLARLELSITQAFDSPQSEPLDAKDLEAVAPEQLGRSRLVTSPSLRLVPLEWNAADYLDTIRDDDHKHPRPRRRRSFIAVVRRNYSVYRFPVTEAAFAVLGDLQKGMSLEAVVRRALGRRGRKRASAEEFSTWFRMWTSEGLFCAVRRAPREIRKRA